MTETNNKKPRTAKKILFQLAVLAGLVLAIFVLSRLGQVSQFIYAKF